MQGLQEKLAAALEELPRHRYHTAGRDPARDGGRFAGKCQEHPHVETISKCQLEAVAMAWQAVQKLGCECPATRGAANLEPTWRNLEMRFLDDAPCENCGHSSFDHAGRPGMPTCASPPILADGHPGVCLCKMTFEE